MSEEQNKGVESSSPASEKKPQGGNPPENANQAEYEKVKIELDEKKAELTRKEKQIIQANYKLDKLQKKAEEAGLVLEESNPETEELKILVGSLKEDMSKLKDEFSNKISEFGRTMTAKINASQGGNAGQSPPAPDKGAEEPTLSLEDKRILASGKFKWDPKRRGYVSPTGRFRAWNDTSGIVAALAP